MQITIQIITNNNEKIIQKTLDSIKCLNSNVLIADESSSDSTINIIKNNNCKIDIIQAEKNKNITRNILTEKSETDWQFMIEPGEIFSKGVDELKKLIQLQENPYRVMILKNGSLTKPVRLWTKSSGLKFKNPIYECIDSINSLQSNVLIIGTEISQRWTERIEEWKINDFKNSSPFYYQAMEFLMDSNYDKFLNSAEMFFFKHEKKNMAYLMMRYYQAMVLCLIKQDTKIGYKHIMECLSIQKNMAEFWCLLGDMYYFILKRGKKAKKFYEAAIENGKKRDIKDEYPMDIAKYKEYPEKMINCCNYFIKEFELQR